MKNSHFNPINMLLNLAIGWFLISFLHALVLTFLFKSEQKLIDQFLQIALFKAPSAALINLGIIAVCGIGGTIIWLIIKRNN